MEVGTKLFVMVERKEIGLSYDTRFTSCILYIRFVILPPTCFKLIDHNPLKNAAKINYKISKVITAISDTKGEMQRIINFAKNT
jgi:hypothetical protein